MIAILSEAGCWKETFAHLRQMREWVLQAEHILDGRWAASPEEITQAQMAERFDAWLSVLQKEMETFSPTDQLFQGLDPLHRTLSHLRPHLLCCYDVLGLPRTNNDLERCIRAIKTRYRRICGRKNWNTYVLRYGSAVAYSEWWHTQPQGIQSLELRLQHMTRGLWREVRQRARTQHHEQLDRFRFQRHRQKFLAELEAQWLAAC